MSQPNQAPASGKERVTICDTTLRDGKPSTGNSARVYVNALDELLVKYPTGASSALTG
jgi:hypothetical protein